MYVHIIITMYLAKAEPEIAFQADKDWLPLSESE